MTQKNTDAFAFDMPRMVCQKDLLEGKKKLDALIEAVEPAKRAIARAENEMLLISACDLIEGAKGLDTVTVSAHRMEDDEDGSYVSLMVDCAYLPSEDEEENIEDELNDVISEVGSDICDTDVAERPLSPKVFMKRLAVALLGEKDGPSWLAERERAKIAEAVPPAKKSLVKPGL